MQKVSKQSLAMIALSILLAISIALTFTFAALQGSKKATGTITFSEGGSVTWATTSDVTADGEAGNVKFALTEADFTIDAGGTSATLTKTFEGAKVTFSNKADKTMFYRVVVTANGVTMTGAVGTANATIASKGADVSIDLNTILPADTLKINADDLSGLSDATIVITAEFNYSAAY